LKRDLFSSKIGFEPFLLTLARLKGRPAEQLSPRNAAGLSASDLEGRDGIAGEEL
jgi:hypothetical protein